MAAVLFLQRRVDAFIQTNRLGNLAMESLFTGFDQSVVVYILLLYYIFVSTDDKQLAAELFQRDAVWYWDRDFSLGEYPGMYFPI